MTNEEAVKQLLDAEHCLAGHGDLWDVDMEAFEMAIKALKQNNTLDKIRAEIENHCGLAKETQCRYCPYCNSLMGVREILEIIDKYKAESEEEE